LRYQYFLVLVAQFFFLFIKNNVSLRFKLHIKLKQLHQFITIQPMKKTLFLSLALCAASSAFAQYFEVGMMGGAMNYQGELSHSLVGTLAETHPSFGVLAKYNASDYISIQGHFLYGEVSGKDVHATEADFKKRDLSFRSDIFELGAQAEINVMGYQPYALSRPFSPYLFVGIAGFYYNPRTLYDNKWVELQPLGTEGQGSNGRGSRYSKIGVAIPFGVGAKYALSDLWTLGLEIGTRPTFTDFLDDVSGQYVAVDELAATNGALAATLGNKVGAKTGAGRGNPDDKDWYNFIGVTISYNFLDNGLVGARNRVRRKSGCKTNM
jgi:opacity protein-like surface antigen